MKFTGLFIFLTGFSLKGWGCTTCNSQVYSGIYNGLFYEHLLTMLSSFIILAIILIILTAISTKNYQRRLQKNTFAMELAYAPLISASMVLGIGLGGFTDGIVLHQILQWHEMLTNQLPATTLATKSINMFWDGIFHVFTLMSTVLGIYLLWNLLNKTHINKSPYLLNGGMLSGWGLFNIVEGVINHHILRLHNVREYSEHPTVWNGGFLAFGLVLLLIGSGLIRSGKKKARIFLKEHNASRSGEADQTQG